MVVVILNNFPFDLSNVKVVDEKEDQSRKKRSEEEAKRPQQVNDDQEKQTDGDDGAEKVIPMEIEGTDLLKVGLSRAPKKLSHSIARVSLLVKFSTKGLRENVPT